MDGLITVRCCACGKEVQIPEELEEFSCLYCGEKQRRPATEEKELIPADENDLAYVREHLFDCIANYPEYYRYFNRTGFENSYREYSEGIRDVFLAMDRYVCAKPNERQTLLEDFTTQFLQDWESYHQKDKRWKHKMSRERMLFDDKLTIAWYLVPAVREMELSVSEEFTSLLQKRFVEKYPDNIFQCTTIGAIRDGFKRRRLCFITTAVCEFECKPDDCEELTAFRRFRDTWLSQSEQGRALTEEYYELAPRIVQAIDLCDNRERVYRDIRNTYLTPCYDALGIGAFDRCRDIYVAMVRDLQKRYHIEN